MCVPSGRFGLILYNTKNQPPTPLLFNVFFFLSRSIGQKPCNHSQKSFRGGKRSNNEVRVREFMVIVTSRVGALKILFDYYYLLLT